MTNDAITDRESNDGAADGATPVMLRAGDLSAKFQADSGMIRTIRWRGVEVLRGIYGAVRDADWNTVPNTMSALRLESHEDRFSVAFDVACVAPPIDFRWRGDIRGDADGTVVYQMSGQAETEFVKNRIGLCVLHPIRLCAGRPCRIESVDGQIVEAEFPKLIAPWQPFHRVRSISYTTADGVRVTSICEGDEFETEDQRNWSDASYKTYSTPLDRPFPVPVAAGFRVEQRVTLRIEQNRSPRAATCVVGESTADEQTLHVGLPVILPRLGLGIPRSAAPLDRVQQRRLRSLSLDHLRIDIELSDAAWRGRLQAARREAAGLSAALHVALYCPPNVTVEHFADVRDATAGGNDAEAAVSTWLLFERGAPVTPTSLLAVARQVFSTGDPRPRLAAGTDAYLAELNRNRPPTGAADLFTFSLTPQVHLGDARSIVESLETHAEMIETVRSFCGDAEVMVSPVTLRPRFNPNATTSQSSHAAQDGSAADPRQSTLLTAAWTLASVIQLARGGAASITFYETLGPRGVIQHVPESSDLDETGYRGRVFPVFHTLADIAELPRHEGVAIRPVAAGCESGGLRGLLVVNEVRATLLLANLCDHPHSVRLPDEMRDRGTAKIRKLTESNVRRAVANPEAFREHDGKDMMGERLDLEPWTYVRVDVRRQG